MEVYKPHQNFKPKGIVRAQLEFNASPMDSEVDVDAIVSALPFPAFKWNNQWHLLTHDVAKAWNYPSSYQLIGKLVKKTNLELSDFEQTSDELSAKLVESQVLTQSQATQTRYFVPVDKLYRVIDNKEVFSTNPSGRVDEPPVAIPKGKAEKIDTVTVAQVFPSINTPIRPTLANFNCLNQQSKLQFYKERGLYKFVPSNKISFTDRELIYQKNPGIYDNTDLDAVIDKTFGADVNAPRKKKREGAGIDPNTLDFSESVLVGQGYFHEFNVAHLCKVASYYPEKADKNSKMLAAQQEQPQEGADADNAKMSKHLQQLVIDVGDKDQLSKYFYSRANRGPVSAYKDQSVVTRITKIPTSVVPVAKTHRVAKPNRDRGNQNIKGLVHPRFNKGAVDDTIRSHSEYVADFLNIEHLHNSLQFNVLVNSYRGVSQQTWDSYYKFKRIDFEQIYSMKTYRDEFEERKSFSRRVEEWKVKEQQRIQRDRAEQERVTRYNYEVSRRRHERMRQQFDAALDGPEFQEQRFVPSMAMPPPKPLSVSHLDVLNRFTMPSVYKEIINGIPTELRDDQGPNPKIKRPISYIVNVPDLHQPEMASRIEVVKIPNSNEVAWDNLRKFKSQLP